LFWFRDLSSSLSARCSYEIYKKEILKRYPKTPELLAFTLAAVGGDLTGSGWLCPSEVVKQTMQRSGGGAVGVVKKILSEKGFGGLYQGYVSNMGRDVSFRVLQMTSFELVKKGFIKWKVKKGQKGELSSIEAAACGAVSGSFR